MQSNDFLPGIVEALIPVRGIKALVPGARTARDTFTQKSDFDLGLYYAPDEPHDLEHLSAVAARLDDEHRPGLVTPQGGWGPWINGGGWKLLTSPAIPSVLPVPFTWPKPLFAARWGTSRVWRRI